MLWCNLYILVLNSHGVRAEFLTGLFNLALVLSALCAFVSFFLSRYRVCFIL